MVRKLFGFLVLATLFTSSAHAKLIVILQETADGSVEFSVNASGDFDGSVSLNHLHYLFFENLGDFVNDERFATFNPVILKPKIPIRIGTKISIPAVGFENDTNVSGGLDDFFLRFTGTMPELVGGDSIGGAFTLLSSRPIRLSNTQFNWFNEGVYFSKGTESNAFGGFELRVVSVQ